MFVYDTSIDELRELDIAFGGRASTVFCSTLSIEERLPDSGPGDRRRAPPRGAGAARDHALAARADAAARGAGRRRDRPGRLLRDLAADDPRRPHLRGRRDDPLLRHQHARRGADHSTYALTNATLPYVLALADHGVAEAARRDPGLRLGINVAGGKVTHPAVAEGVGWTTCRPSRCSGSDAPGHRRSRAPTAPGRPAAPPQRALTQRRRPRDKTESKGSDWRRRWQRQRGPS